MNKNETLQAVNNAPGSVVLQRAADLMMWQNQGRFEESGLEYNLNIPHVTRDVIMGVRSNFLRLEAYNEIKAMGGLESAERMWNALKEVKPGLDGVDYFHNLPHAKMLEYITMANAVTEVETQEEDDIDARVERGEPDAASTPGQVAYETWAGEDYRYTWDGYNPRERARWESVAQSVIAWHKQQSTPELGQCPSMSLAGVRCSDDVGHLGAHIGGGSAWPNIATDPESAPDPAWSPTVGGWAEYPEYGRVLIFGRDPEDPDGEWRWAKPGKEWGFTGWCATADLSAPVPREWDTAEDVPEHVVVEDRSGYRWNGGERPDPIFGPFTEIVGGVL